MYIIVKYIKNDKNVEVPVVMIDTHSEVWEFNTRDDAENMKDILEKNSDSGWRYVVKKIGDKR